MLPRAKSLQQALQSSSLAGPVASAAQSVFAGEVSEHVRHLSPISTTLEGAKYTSTAGCSADMPLEAHFTQALLDGASQRSFAHSTVGPPLSHSTSLPTLLLEQRKLSHYHASTSTTYSPPSSRGNQQRLLNTARMRTRSFSSNAMDPTPTPTSAQPAAKEQQQHHQPSPSPADSTAVPSLQGLQSLTRSNKSQQELLHDSEAQIPPWEDASRADLPDLLNTYRMEMKHGKTIAASASKVAVNNITTTTATTNELDGNGSDGGFVFRSPVAGIGGFNIGTRNNLNNLLISTSTAMTNNSYSNSDTVSRLPFLEDAVQSVNLQQLPLFNNNNSGGSNNQQQASNTTSSDTTNSSPSFTFAETLGGFIDRNEDSHNVGTGTAIQQEQVESGGTSNIANRWEQAHDNNRSPRSSSRGSVTVAAGSASNSFAFGVLQPPQPTSYPSVQSGDHNSMLAQEQQQQQQQRGEEVEVIIKRYQELPLQVQVGLVCSALAPLLPLHRAQWIAIAEALRLAVPGTISVPILDPDTQILSPPLPITPESAQRMATFLLQDCALSELDTLKLIASHAWLLGADPAVYGKHVLEFLKVLDMDSREIAMLVSRYPRVLVADVDAHLLPLAAYLEELGFKGRELADFLLHFPRIVESHALQDLTSSVAFWVGKGLSKHHVVRLLNGVPQVVGMSQQLVQLKYDWLTEHAGFKAADFVALPKVLAQPLASVIGPRLQFARQLNITVLPPSKYVSMLHSHTGLEPRTIAMNALVLGESRFFKSINSDKLSFEAFASHWRHSEFSAWLAARSSGSLQHYQTLNWLEEEDVSALRKRHAVHAQRREEAWAQQKEREKDWKKVWLEWKRDQKGKEKAQKLLERSAERQAEQQQYATHLEDLVRASLQEQKELLEASQREPEPCSRSEGCVKFKGHVGRCRIDPTLITDRKNSSTTPPPPPNNTNNGTHQEASFEVKETLQQQHQGSAADWLSAATKVLQDWSIYSGLTSRSGPPRHHVDADPLSFTNDPVKNSTTTQTSQADEEKGEEQQQEEKIKNNNRCVKRLGCVRPAGHKGVCDVAVGEEHIVMHNLRHKPAEIRDCAAGLEALLRGAPEEHVRAASIAEWAREQGYSPGCLHLAKGILSSTGIAELAIQETSHHQYHGDKVWRIRNPSIGRTRECESGVQSPYVTAASAMLEELKKAPGGMVSARELEAWALSRFAKTVYKRAVMLLYEEGRAVRQRRYVKGRKGARGEVVFLDAVEVLAKLSEEEVGFEPWLMYNSNASTCTEDVTRTSASGGGAVTAVDDGQEDTHDQGWEYSDGDDDDTAEFESSAHELSVAGEWSDRDEDAYNTFMGLNDQETTHTNSTSGETSK